MIIDLLSYPNNIEWYQILFQLYDRGSISSRTLCEELGLETFKISDFKLGE